MSSASVARAAQLAPGGGGVTRQLSQVSTACGDRLRSLQETGGGGGEVGNELKTGSNRWVLQLPAACDSQLSGQRWEGAWRCYDARIQSAVEAAGISSSTSMFGV